MNEKKVNRSFYLPGETLRLLSKLSAQTGLKKSKIIEFSVKLFEKSDLAKNTIKNLK